jgi:ATP-dependent Lhr-like helicase
MGSSVDDRAALDAFHPAVAAWFRETFDAPTEPQVRGWPSIRARRHTLIAAPTGSGKTLAAFLAAIDDLVVQGLDGTLEEATQVVYVSPLKALSNDIHRNLESPLAGIQRQLLEMGHPPVEIRAMVRSGDTPSHERTRMVKNPPHILVTTPESLYLLLTSDGGRNMLRTSHTVIVDEIHAMANDKRGSHLALSLERLDDLAGTPLTRIGLSATQRPIEKVARFLVGRGRGGGFPLADDGGGRHRPEEGAGAPACTIIDSGHRRAMDIALELPSSPLEAIMSNEVWEEVYARLAELVSQHRTTLIFVNTRRLTERTAHHLSDLIGADNIAAHHGSLSREQRLDAEQRLKAGTLKCMVATASLELGIDIGDVDLVCQLGSTRWISTMLQRIGRSGHTLAATPKGRIFPLSRDELVECVALLDAVQRGELDTLIIPEKPLDILAQQLVAEVGAGERSEDELFDMMRRADCFRDLTRDEFDDVVTMLADGFTTRRGRRGAHIHHDQVNGRLRPRRGARLAALTSGGAIPDVADFRVIMEPADTFVGTVDQDFAIESLPGDIFQLGNQSYRILRIESAGVLRVEDARGLPPTIPFWFGEAPGRSAELSHAVSRLRQEIGDALIEAMTGRPAAPEPVGAGTVEEGGAAAIDGSMSAQAPIAPDEAAVAQVAGALVERLGIARAAADQLVEYLAAAQAALGGMPTQERLIIERFFDEAGDMHVVVHSPFGSRLNRAWGLSLRKRFCRSFNFELQASATEDAIILSLGPTHSFPLEDVFKFLHASSVRDILIQAFLDAPMFPTRWRWNAQRALAVLRWRGGKRVPPHLQQMDAEDLIAVVFPDQLACLENIAGDREIPDHPLIDQTIRDCLEEAMDIEALEALLDRIAAGEVELVARDLREPSPMAHEIIGARPYAFLDDGEAEERRTLAIRTSRWMDPRTAADLGKLDAAAIARVRNEAWPDVRDHDELHDALMLHGFVTEAEGRRGDIEPFDAPVQERRAAESDAAADAAGAPRDDDESRSECAGTGWLSHFDELVAEGRATRLWPDPQRHTERCLWIAAERLPELRALHPGAVVDPDLVVPERMERRAWTPDEAAVEIVRGRLEGVGPTTAAELADDLATSVTQIDKALLMLEGEGFVLRGHFSAAVRTEAESAGGDSVAEQRSATATESAAKQDGTGPADVPLEWCERRLLQRIHRYTLNRLRAEIEPVGARDFMSFLLAWQRVAGDEPASGAESLSGLIEQLEGFPAAAAAWESEILPARLADYDPVWLDALCLAGRLAWGRMPPPPSGSGSSANGNGGNGGGRRGGPIRTTPTTLLSRDLLGVWQSFATPPEPADLALTGEALVVLDLLHERGASFFKELAAAAGLLDTQLEAALGELVAWGLITADSFTGLRALLVPSSKRPTKRGGRRKGSVAIFGVENAGRWSLLWPSAAAGAERAGDAADGEAATVRGDAPPTDATAAGVAYWDDVEEIARVLLRRYGVIFRRLLEREGKLPPWRDLLRVYRRMEARGEIRGGRFVAGFSGEQFALPEAIPLLRKARRTSAGGMVSISAADPLNLVGIVTAGERVPALVGNRVLFDGGMPIATMVSGEVSFLVDLDVGAQWEAKNQLVRRTVPPQLRAYLGRSA